MVQSGVDDKSVVVGTLSVDDKSGRSGLAAQSSFAPGSQVGDKSYGEDNEGSDSPGYDRPGQKKTAKFILNDADNGAVYDCLSDNGSGGDENSGDDDGSAGNGNSGDDNSGDGGTVGGDNSGDEDDDSVNGNSGGEFQRRKRLDQFEPGSAWQGPLGFAGVNSSRNSTLALWGASWASMPPLPSQVAEQIVLGNSLHSHMRWRAASGAAADERRYFGNRYDVEFAAVDWIRELINHANSLEYPFPDPTHQENWGMRVVVSAECPWPGGLHCNTILNH
jgi:hypothetical protein